MSNYFEAAGTWTVDPPGRVRIPPGMTIFTLSILADVVDVGYIINGGALITVPAGTTFGRGGSDFPRSMPDTLLEFQLVGGVDPGSRWFVAWGKYC